MSQMQSIRLGITKGSAMYPNIIPLSFCLLLTAVPGEAAMLDDYSGHFPLFVSWRRNRNRGLHQV